MLVQIVTCNMGSVCLPDNNDRSVETTVMLHFAQQLFKYVGKALRYSKLLGYRLGFFNPEKDHIILNKSIIHKKT